MSDVQRRAIFEAGLTLHALQITEHQVSFCLTWVFPKDANTRLRELFAADLRHQKLTLGQLLAELRKRAEIADDFDELLADFVNKRNRFVHKLLTEDQYQLQSDVGAAKAIEFMLPLQELAVTVQDTFHGHLVSWGKNSEDRDLKAVSEQLLQKHPRLRRIANEGRFKNRIRRSR
ncbi:MAG TPA: hypothetical protein VLH83_10260 [Chthoniobacterales bacterium]|nr:hypothetical protein [Chthoniobacterales bacterium]